jgi:hypothetical protein
MNIKDFSEIKISTITGMIFPDKDINLPNVFRLLPIGFNPYGKTKVVKDKILTVDNPGVICSLHYLGNNRGIELGSKSFKNSINISISLEKRWTSVMMNKNNFKICGARSYEDLKYLAKVIVDKINYINRMLTIIKIRKNDVIRILNIIDANYVTTKFSKNQTGEKKVTKILNREKIHEDSHIFSDIFGSLNILKFLLWYIEDFNNIENYYKFIYHLLETNIGLFEGNELKIISVKKCLYNYNYSIGFKLSRVKLALGIEKYENFITRYINQIEEMVKIKNIITDELDSDTFRKGEPTTTFIVYGSGEITQTSPDEKTGRKSFESFMEIIREIYNDIVILT